MDKSSLYVPSWPCPTASQFASSNATMPFPLAREHAKHFYVARNGIYHLFGLFGWRAPENVLVPNYHSGNETSAIRAAGVPMRFYPVNENFELDRGAIEQLCTPYTRALYVIHYAGWPQPMEWVADFCRRRNLLLIEDCALSFLSEYNGRPLGSFGDYAIHCLYKSLPLPNGAVLSGRGPLPEVKTHRPDAISVAGRCAELSLESLRSSMPVAGKLLADLKAALGRGLTAAKVERERVGNIGFDLSKVDTAMSPLCHWLLQRLDYRAIVERRRNNFQHLAELLKGKVSLLPVELSEGICPLFLPVLAENKHETAEELRRRGIGVVEFWNEGDPAADDGAGAARFLRRHVIELPIHQNVTEAQVEAMARVVLASIRPVEKKYEERVCFANS